MCKLRPTKWCGSDQIWIRKIVWIRKDLDLKNYEDPIISGSSKWRGFYLIWIRKMVWIRKDLDSQNYEDPTISGSSEWRGFYLIWIRKMVWIRKDLDSRNGVDPARSGSATLSFATSGESSPPNPWERTAYSELTFCKMYRNRARDPCLQSLTRLQ